MSDVKDILGVSRAPGAAGGGGGLTAGAVLPAGTPAAAAAAALAGIDKADQRDRAAGAGAGAAQRPARPAGMSREAFALLDTAHPIAPTAAAAALKAAGVARGAPKHKKGKGGSKKKVKGEGRAEKQKKKKKNAFSTPSPPYFSLSSPPQITWQWLPFDNPARPDGLRLAHWTKCTPPDAQAIGNAKAAGLPKPAPSPLDGAKPYPFAAFNLVTLPPRPDDAEWGALVPPDPGWGREETEHLLDLWEAFGGRWALIGDRYCWPPAAEAEAGAGAAQPSTSAPAGGAAAKKKGGGPAAATAPAPPPPPPSRRRSLEDLKERFYSVARALVVGREGSEAGAAAHPLAASGGRGGPGGPYPATAERERRAALAALLARTPADEAADAAALEAAKAVDASRREAAAAAEAVAAAEAAAAAGPGGPAGAPPAFAAVPPPGVPSLFDAAVRPARPPPGAHLRSRSAKAAAAAQVAAAGGGRAGQALAGALVELGIPPTPAGPATPSRDAVGAWLALRSETLDVLALRRTLAARAAATAAEARAAAAAAAAGEGGGGGGGAQKKGGGGRAGSGGSKR